MATILITGGTGLTGRALTEALLKKGHQLIILSRRIPEVPVQHDLSYALWDVNKQSIDEQAVLSADYIVHLAGAGVVEKKWTEAYKKEIVDSRTNSSRLLIDTLKKYPNKVKAVISASAIGWYGADTGHGAFTETDSPDKSFLGDTCRLWEESIEPVTQLGKRLVKFRIGIVLSNEGGALAEFKKPLQVGVAAILGNGKQMISWIHIDDLVNMYIHAIENEALTGSYNAVSPLPVNNSTLTLTLAKAMNPKFFIPIHVPPFLLKLVMGQRSIEILKSAIVSCKKIRETGFDFLYPSIEAAIANLVCVGSGTV